MALPRLADTALEGMGAILPPHISIRGNQFTLVDASGAEQPVTFVAQDGKSYPAPFLDVVIADIGGTAKQFYPPDKPWSPDSADPPLCFSTNGIYPSREAQSPQSLACAACQWNVRGSKMSAISGAAIKACRDEKWLAVIPVNVSGMIFQFRLTPGSFGNWRAYGQKFQGQPIDIPDVVTRLTFAPNQNGVVVFEATQHTDPALKQAVEKARIEKKTDVYVGRDGTAALPPPTVTPPTIAPPAQAASGPFVAPSAASLPTGVAPPFVSPPTANPVPLAAPSEPARRTRRTKAQIAADNAAQAANLVHPNVIPPPMQQQPVRAPFAPAPPPPAAAPFAPNGQGAPAFGVGQGAPPNPALSQMLNDVLGPPGGQK